MDTISWVLYASATAWFGIGLYVFFLAKRQSNLSKRINHLERMEGKK